MMPTSFFQNFISGGIISPDKEILGKARAINILLLMLIILFSFLCVFFYLIGAEPLFLTTVSASLLSMFAILLLRITKRPLLAGNFAFFVFWAAFAIIRWNSGAMSEGGIALLVWIWNATLILMAVFIAGYFWGTIWGSLIFIETGFAVHLYRNGYQFPNLIPPDILPIYSLGAYLSGLLVILLIAFLYEWEKTGVSDRQQSTAKALIESKSYIDTIIERLPFPTFIIDREHRVIHWNRACQLMTDISPGNIIGRKVPSVLHVDHHLSLADIIIDDPGSITHKFSGSILSKTDSGLFEIGIPLPNVKKGIEAIITVAPIYDINGSIKGAIETIEDMTNLKREGYKAFGKHDRITESPSYPTFKVDSKGKISFWNQACEAIFGYPSSSMVGQTPLSFVSKSTRQHFKETVVRVFKGESFDEKEWKYYSAEGNPVYVLAKVYLTQQGCTDKMRECVVVNTDVTGLMMKMKALEQMAIEMKEKLKTITDEYSLLRKNIARYIRTKK